MELFSETTTFSEETRALLALRLVPGIGPRLTAALVERFGSAQNALQASAHELQEISHIGPELAQKLKQSLTQGDVDEEIALMRKFEVNLVIAGQPGYPTAL